MQKYEIYTQRYQRNYLMQIAFMTGKKQIIRAGYNTNVGRGDRELTKITLHKNWSFPFRIYSVNAPCPPPHFLCSKKKKGKQRKARKAFKAETIKRLSLRSKLYCFSHSRASRIQILFRVPWPLHLEIHFAGTESVILSNR